MAKRECVYKEPFTNDYHHVYRLMTPNERKEFGVRSNGVGTWICMYCDHITHSM